MIRRIWQFPFFDINIVFIDIRKLIMGKNRKKQGKPQRIRLFHQNLCEAHGKSYKKSVICAIAFDRRQRHVIDSRRNTPAVYPPPLRQRRTRHAKYPPVSLRLASFCRFVFPLGASPRFSDSPFPRCIPALPPHPPHVARHLLPLHRGRLSRFPAASLCARRGSSGIVRAFT